MLSILSEAVTTSSPQFINLNARLNDVEQSLEKGSDKEEILQEINSLLVASDINTFNDSLIDIVNVLADLSQQSLPGINQTQAKKDKSNSQASSYLVGNPNYGSWQTRGSDSIWVWYVQYRLFNSLFYRPYYYHSWYYNRPYSHYNDYAAKNYASQKYRRNINNIHQRNYTKTRAYGKSHNLRYKERVNRPKRLSSYASRSHRLECAAEVGLVVNNNNLNMFEYLLTAGLVQILIINIALVVLIMALAKYVTVILSKTTQPACCSIQDNPAFSISVAGTLISLSIILTGVISGDASTSLVNESLLVLSYGIGGILLMIIARILFDSFAMRGISLKQEIAKGQYSLCGG